MKQPDLSRYSCPVQYIIETPNAESFRTAMSKLNRPIEIDWIKIDVSEIEARCEAFLPSHQVQE